MLYAIIGILVIIADQYIKFWVMGHIPVTSAGEAFVPGILSLANVHNDGAAFGFLSGSGARIPFIILAGVFTLVVIIALATKLISGRLARWSIVLVTAGGLSNCLDRVLYGYVQDMFKLEFINFPVFNLADVFITVFAIVFALAVIFGKTHSDEDDEDEFEDYEEEEEEAPRVSRRKQKRSSRRAARVEDDLEEEEPAPARKSVKSKLPKRRREEKSAEEETEAVPVQQAPKTSKKRVDAEDEQPAVAPAPAKKTSPAKRQQQSAAAVEDPFAAWDKANEKAASQSRPRAAAASAAPAQKAAQPAAAAPVQQRKPAAAPAAAPAPARPAPKPVVTAEPEEEFSLDDILNEFR